MGVVTDLTVRMGADTAGLMSGIGSASGSLQGMIGIVGRINPIVGVFAGLASAAIGFGAASVKAAGDFQQGITTLSTGAGEAQKNLQMVSDGILSLATSTGTSTKQLTDGMYMIESAGYHGKAGLDVLRAAAEGAKVGNADLGTVSDATTTIMTDFASKNVTASQAVNTLVATVSNGKTTMQALAGSLSQIMPTASAAGVSLTDTSAAMATMTGEGVPAAQAATYLRQMLIGLDAPSKQTTDALANIGLSSKQVSDEMKVSLPGALQLITDHLKTKFPEGSAAYVNALKEISGGSKNMQGMLDLTGSHLQTFKANVDNITSSVKKGGDSINGWSQVQQNFNFKVDQAKEALETLGIKIGTALLPVVGNLLSGITPLITGFTNLFTSSSPLSPLFSRIGDAFKQLGQVFKSPEFQTMQSAFTGLGVTIGQVLMPVIKPLAQQFISLFSNQSVSSGANGLKSAFVNIRDAVNSVTGYVQSLSGKFAELGPKIKPIIDAMGNYGTAIRNTFMTIMQTMGPIIAGIINIVMQLVGFIVQMLPSIYNIAAQVMNGVSSVFKTVGPVITGSLIPAIQHLISVIGPVIVQIVQWIEKSGILPVIFNIIGLALKTMVQIIADNINRVTTIIQIIIVVITAIVTSTIFAVNSIRNSWNMVVGWVTVAINAVRTVIMSIWNSIMTWWHTSTSGASNNVHSVFAAIPAWLGAIWAGIQVGIQTAWNAVLNFFKNIWNNIVSTISGAINTVVGWFQWLYDHNTYFQMLCDFIRNVITAVVTWLTDTWNNIVNWISQKWAMLSAYANAYWMMIQMIIQEKIQQVVSWLQGIWNNIVGWISGQWARLQAYANMYWAMIQMEIQNVVNQVVNFLQSKWSQLSQLAQNAWNAVVGVFRNAWGGISGALSGIWNNISNWFSNLASQAITWGKNIINGFIDGINSMIGAAGNAASNIVANVAKTLGFHSPAKEGPGKDADTWAPNLMRMFIGGITAAVPQVRSATLSVVNELTAMNGSSSYQYTGRSNSLGMLAVAQAQSSREQHIHVHVGNEEIAHYVTNEQMKMVRLGGYRR